MYEDDLMKETIKEIIVLTFIIVILFSTPRLVKQAVKLCSNKQTVSLNVEDKYYQYFRWGKQYDIIVKCNNKEKKIMVSKDDFHEIKMGDKVLCNVYYIGKKIVVIELNERWNET